MIYNFYLCIEIPDSFSDILECSSNPCENGGICNEETDGYTCDCLYGYSGYRCQVTPCDSSPCVNNGTCNNYASDYGTIHTCNCLDGWTGANCETGESLMEY